MSLVPMKFRFHHSTTRQAHRGHAFQFAPRTSSEIPIQAIENADSVTGGDDLDRSNLGQNLEVHQPSLAVQARCVVAPKAEPSQNGFSSDSDCGVNNLAPSAVITMSSSKRTPNSPRM